MVVVNEINQDATDAKPTFAIGQLPNGDRESLGRMSQASHGLSWA
jgi:hypothetical protein